MARYLSKPGALMACLLLCCSTMAAVVEDVDGEELRDPTAPLYPAGREDSAGEQAGLPTGSLRLSSILIRPNQRIAVINGRQLSVGDQVGSARVVSIETDVVTVESAGSRRQLRLHANSIKQSR